MDLAGLEADPPVVGEHDQAAISIDPAAASGAVGPAHRLIAERVARADRVKHGIRGRPKPILECSEQPL